MICGNHELGCKHFRGEKCDCILTNNLRRMKDCKCEIKDRLPDEEQRDWLKRCMCQFHWMETDYYKAKLKETEGQPKLSK